MSWLDSMGTRCSPSQKASTVTSGPTMHSSMTTVEPEATEFVVLHHGTHGLLGLLHSGGHHHALAQARPSAFTTMGAPCART